MTGVGDMKYWKIDSEKTRSWKQMKKHCWGWCVLQNWNLALFMIFKCPVTKRKKSFFILSQVYCICFDYFCNLFSLDSFAILSKYSSNTLAQILFLIWWKWSICFHFILVFEMQFNISMVLILKLSDVCMHCWNHCRMLNKLFLTSESSLEWQRKMTIGLESKCNDMRSCQVNSEILFKHDDFCPHFMPRALTLWNEIAHFK